MEVPADCRSCGACCYSNGIAYVAVTGDDWSRLGEAADRLAHFIGHRAYMRMVDHHCVALIVRCAEPGRVSFHCSIYDRRPEVCRELARGSPQCEAERAAKATVGIIAPVQSRPVA